MKEVKVTLIGDGSSDKALIPIVKWLMDDLFPERPNRITFANFSPLKNPPQKENVQEQIEYAKEYYPFDVLLYHRDAETNEFSSLEIRKKEIMRQVKEIHRDNIVCIIPIKMMETWLLINTQAIKKAAGNRNLSEKLPIPKITQLENHSSPKQLLHKILKQASGLKGRRLKNFNVHSAVHLVAENIDDFSLLRNLPAFSVFENELKRVLKN